jgi:hypothetical protein
MPNIIEQIDFIVTDGVPIGARIKLYNEPNSVEYDFDGGTVATTYDPPLTLNVVAE